MTCTIQTQTFKLQVTPEDLPKKKKKKRYPQQIFLDDEGRAED